MVVTVYLHTVLQRQTPEGLVRQLKVSLPPKSTLDVLLTELAIDFPLDALLLVVNGRLAELDHILQEGDRVNLMPAISGGSAMLRPGPSSGGTVEIQFDLCLLASNRTVETKFAGARS
jgi:sulfur carrier protein ThiS